MPGSLCLRSAFFREVLAGLSICGTLAFGACGPPSKAAPHFEFGARDEGTDFPGPDTVPPLDAHLPTASGYGFELHAVAGTYTNDTTINPTGVIADATFMIVTLRDASGNGPTGPWALSFDQSGMTRSTMQYPAGATFVNAYPDRKMLKATGAMWTIVATDLSDSSHQLRYDTRVADPTKTINPPSSVTAGFPSPEAGAPDGAAVVDAGGSTVIMTWDLPTPAAKSFLAALVPHRMPTAQTFSTTVGGTTTSAALAPTGNLYDESVTAFDVDEVALATDGKQVPSLPSQVNASEGTGINEITVP